MKLVVRENEHGMEEINEKPFKRSGTRGGGRTHNLWLRRPALYPIELRAQKNYSSPKTSSIL